MSSGAMNAAFHADESTSRLNLVLLGIGTDGHNASLFPEAIVPTVLAPQNRGRWVLPVHLHSGGAWRPETPPAQLIEPQDGDLTWFLDRTAATQLDG